MNVKPHRFKAIHTTTSYARAGNFGASDCAFPRWVVLAICRTSPSGFACVASAFPLAKLASADRDHCLVPVPNYLLGIAYRLRIPHLASFRKIRVSRRQKWFSRPRLREATPSDWLRSARFRIAVDNCPLPTACYDHLASFGRISSRIGSPHLQHRLKMASFGSFRGVIPSRQIRSRLTLASFGASVSARRSSCLLPTAYCLLPTAYCLLPSLSHIVIVGRTRGPASSKLWVLRGCEGSN